MIELFSIYKYAFVLVIFTGIVLTIQGSHLVARKESLQVLSLSQSAVLGALVSALFLHEHSDILSFGISLAFLVIVKIFMNSYSDKSEPFYIVSYLFFIATGYFLISLFPMLDSHMAASFFGDIVSLSETKTLILIAVFTLFLSLYLYKFNDLIQSTFKSSILKIKKQNIMEEVLLTLVLTTSLFSLGFLYTVSFMIFPIVVLGKSFKNFKQSLIIMSSISVLASVMGLALSIIYSRVSTVSAQVIILLLFLLIYKLILRWTPNGK